MYILTQKLTTRGGAMAYLRMFPNTGLLLSQKIIKLQNQPRYLSILPNLKNESIFAKAVEQNQVASSVHPIRNPISSSVSKDFPFSGLEDVMMGYIVGKKRATEVAHSIWKHVVQEGDTVIDATCGNGYDTLALVKMIADGTHRGRVYAMDIQKVALESTSSLLDKSLTVEEKQLVELYTICHSRMEEIVPKDVSVRLVAFNLGYLPGSDKKFITKPETTLLALEATKRILARGGLISIVVYVGHSGGREELEKIQAFASALPVENWTCCKLEMLNRPSAPVPIFLFKR